MTSRDLIISSANQNLVVKGNKDLLLKLAKSPFATRYIPEYSHTWGPNQNHNTYDLLIEEGKRTCFVHSTKTAKLTLGQNSPLSTEDIITVVDYCLDYKRQANGVYVIHGSACSQGQTGIVFFGSISGIGKTSININMCQKYGFDFIGDDKVLVSSEANIIGGAKSLYFNKPELFHWLDADLHDVDVKTSDKFNIAKEKSKCTLFIQPIITPYCEGLAVSKWDHNKANWHLYEELSRKIRGTSRRIADYRIGLQSIDSNTLTQKRISAVELIIETAEFYSILGSKDSISKYIYESILKN